jgi:DNA adenine methylase
VEPFIGSATVSLNVNANRYLINDMNYDLINLYQHVINNCNQIVELSKPYFENMTSERYYDIRDRFNSLQSNCIERAALFLVLNKFAFNGVCRYNSKGLFNVPYCKRSTAGFPLNELISFSKHFGSKEHQLFHGDFSNAMLYANLIEGDVVYFDPPYLPSDDFESNFTKYTKENFETQQHQQIVDLCLELNTRGVVCLVSNHMTAQTEQLYSECDKIVVIPKKRLLAANKKNRKEINEILAIYGNVKVSGTLFDD